MWIEWEKQTHSTNWSLLAFEMLENKIETTNQQMELYQGLEHRETIIMSWNVIKFTLEVWIQ